ncbi:MAG: hypothetical protein FWC79_07200 [Oscillospiraceae bacterium]|nr:hypothetical protein [Oscillospiraceae bacterium]
MKELETKYYFQNLESFEHKELFEGCIYPWEALIKVKEYLKEKVVEPDLKVNKAKSTAENCTITGNYFIDEGTVISPNAIIEGPVHIGKNCKIKPGAYVRPGTITGDDVEIGYNAEVKNSIVQNGCKIASLTFVGDSVLGKSARIGSGVVTANRRFDQANVWAKIGKEQIDMEIDFFGAVVGDNTRLGANATTIPGTFIGPYSWIFPTCQVRGFIPAEKRMLPKEEYIMMDNPRVELKS